VCALARILLISCVITSQRFARGGGGSRARADSLRTPKCSAQRGVDEMFALGWRQKHAGWHVLRSRWWTVWTLSSTPPPKEVRGRIRTKPGRQRCATTSPKTARPLRSTSRTPGERAPQVLASLQECQRGRCSCPTDQYDRLASIEVGGGDDELTVHLTPRPGEHLDPDALRACMDYTLESASDNQS
jgi:hypothetical protein